MGLAMTHGRAMLAALAALSLSTAIAPRAAAQGGAQASRWREIGRTVVGNPVYVDRRSVKTDSGIVTATLRVVFVKPVKTPKGELTASHTVAMLDCAKQRVGVKENTFFHDEKTNSVYQHSKVAKPGFGPAIKGSMPDVALAELCKGRAPASPARPASGG